MAVYHILPINDIESHEEAGTMCKCGPKVTFVENGDMLVVHNSFDGREILEKIEEGFKNNP